VRGLASEGVTVSVDTMRASVAARALAAGAALVNDVSGGLADAAMIPAVADAGAPFVVMHWRGHSDHMQDHARYTDVVTDVARELDERLEAVVAAGVGLDQVVLDPGIGFAKTAEHNWALLARLDELLGLGRPLLIGSSRKSFLGALLASGDEPRPVVDRDDATAALTVTAALAGAWAVRVHEVRASADAVRVVARMRAEREVPLRAEREVPLRAERE
jgi:dihydropteroate synthase